MDDRRGDPLNAPHLARSPKVDQKRLILVGSLISPNPFRTISMTRQHPFEKALLGRAPFRCVRVEEIVHMGPNGHSRAGSSCDFCGTSIRWVFFIHSSDGKEFKVGCDCVAKTHDANLKNEVAKARREHKAEVKRSEIRQRASGRRQAFLDEYPGLEEALKLEHPITADIAKRFQQYGSLSARQIDLVFVLAERANLASLEAYGCANPPLLDFPRVEGRILVEAKVLSTKLKEGPYGNVLKALYEVRTPMGYWKAWGTLPAGTVGDVRGKILKIRTRLEPSQEDPQFGYFNRPTLVKG